MNFAIDYAPFLPSPMLCWEDGKEPEQSVLPYQKGKPKESEEKRIKFLDSLTPDDTLWLEMGPTHRLALSAHRRGVSVRRVSGHETKKIREQSGLRKNQTVQVLYDLATGSPEVFYPYEELDQQVAEVGLLGSAYYTIQDFRKRGVSRLAAVQRDLYMVEPAGQVEAELSIRRKLTELIYFKEALTAEPDKALEGLVADLFKAIEDVMYEEMRRRISRIPVFRGVFDQVPQLGPAMSSIMIWKISDPKFFPTKHHLKHYAGLHQMEDGSAPKRQSGVQADWDDDLKQAFWLFARQIRIYAKPHNNAWRAAYEARLAYEMEKTLPDDEKIVRNASPAMLNEVRRRRAMRWLAQKLCDHLYRRWKIFNAGGQYQPPDFQIGKAVV